MATCFALEFFFHHRIFPTLHGGEESEIDEARFVFCSGTTDLGLNGVGPSILGGDANVDGSDGFLAAFVGGPAIPVTEMAKSASALARALGPS